MSKCKISGKKLLEIYDFGKQPLGNGFLTKRRFPKEYFFDPLIFFIGISDNRVASVGIYRYWDGLELHGRTG